jgi:hypothetical protein
MNRAYLRDGGLYRPSPLPGCPPPRHDRRDDRPPLPLARPRHPPVPLGQVALRVGRALVPRAVLVMSQVPLTARLDPPARHDADRLAAEGPALLNGLVKLGPQKLVRVTVSIGCRAAAHERALSGPETARTPERHGGSGGTVFDEPACGDVGEPRGPQAQAGAPRERRPVLHGLSAGQPGSFDGGTTGGRGTAGFMCTCGWPARQ